MLYGLFKKRYLSFVLSLGCLIALFAISGLGNSHTTLECQLGFGITIQSKWIRSIIVFCFTMIVLRTFWTFYEYRFKKGESFDVAFRMSIPYFTSAMFGASLPLLWSMSSYLPFGESLFWRRMYVIACFMGPWFYDVAIGWLDRLYISLLFTPIGAYFVLKYIDRHFSSQQAEKETEVRACLDRADVYLNQMGHKDYSGALAEYGRAIQIDSKRPDLFAQRAFIYFEQGDYTHALADIEEAITLAPNNGLYLYRARIHFTQENYAEVITDCTKVLQHTPAHEEFYHLRSIAFREQGEYEKAVTDCKKALESQPKNGGLYYSLAEVYALQNDYINAFVNISKAIDCDPSKPLYYKKRAIVYEQLGNPEKAKADLDEAENMIYQEYLEDYTKGGLERKKARGRKRVR